MSENVKEILERLVNTSSSSESDSRFMQVILNKCGFHEAVVVSGIVYLEGRGTFEAPPTSIQSVAQILLGILNHKAQADYEPTEEECGF